MSRVKSQKVLKIFFKKVLTYITICDKLKRIVYKYTREVYDVSTKIKERSY